MEKKKMGPKLRLALIILGVYLLVLIAAAVLIDGRHAEITLLGESEMTVEVGSEFTDPGAEAISTGRIFGSSKKPKSLSGQGQVDTGKLGEYTISYTASVLGRETRLERHVRVVDTQPPVIELNHIEGYKASWFTGYEEEGYTARDNCDGDITGRVERTETEDRIIYTVKDSSGNEARAERQIEYSISTPSISLNGDADMTMTAAMRFSEPGYRAADSLGNDLTGYVTVSGSVCPYVPGSYELTYSITNDRGDMASAKRRVNVVAAERPEVKKPDKKTIYLTFDDGPGPYTEQLLDILSEYGAKATFFVTGTDTRYSDMIGRAYREGHSIGVHTYTHDYNSIYSSEQAYFDDFNAVEQLIYEQTGSYTSLFRFPGGSSNTVSRFNPGIMSRLAAAMESMGYRYFDWNVSSGDAGETTVTSQVTENIIAGCSGKTAAVVLQHDIKNYSVNAVEAVLIWGTSNGYSFEALDMTSYEAHHSIAN